MQSAKIMVGTTTGFDPLTMHTIEKKIKDCGLSFGFNTVGITSPEPFYRDEKATIERLDRGLMDGLPWYTKDRVRKANHPEVLLPDAKSIISVAVGYLSTENDEIQESTVPRGKIARYARGLDYHNILKPKLRKFSEQIPVIAGKPVRCRIFVDDGPMNDRAAAERAGVGWFGKNTNIITQSHGSWVLLGQIITDLRLKPDIPLKKNCGSCVQCIIDCPTNAIVAPYTIDNTKCISFYTIELRGVVPRDMRHLIGNWVFGCDICQEVCPPNIKALAGSEPAFEQRQDLSSPELIPLLYMSEESFRNRFRNSPIKRAKLIGLKRNVCIALGNIGNPIAVPPLITILNSSEPLLRLHAAWALGKIGGVITRKALLSALSTEQDDSVSEELHLSLKDMSEC